MRFVHIGMQRSGSTWLQQSVFPRHPRLNVITPSLPVFHPLIAALYEAAPGFDVHTWKQHMDAAIESALGLAPDDESVGLSNENLCGHIYSAAGWNLVAERLAQAYGETKIILVLRHPLSFLPSAYAYGASFGSITQTLAQFLAARRDELLVRLNYVQLVTAYRSEFGAENVLVLPFELLREDTAQFTRLIWDFLCVDYIEPDTSMQIRRNQATSKASTALLRAANRLDRLWGPFLEERPQWFNRTVKKMLRSPLSQWLERRMPGYAMLHVNDIPPAIAATLVPDNYAIWSDELARFNYTFDRP